MFRDKRRPFFRSLVEVNQAYWLGRFKVKIFFTSHLTIKEWKVDSRNRPEWNTVGLTSAGDALLVRGDLLLEVGALHALPLGQRGERVVLHARPLREGGEGWTIILLKRRSVGVVVWVGLEGRGGYLHLWDGLEGGQDRGGWGQGSAQQRAGGRTAGSLVITAGGGGWGDVPGLGTAWWPGWPAWKPAWLDLCRLRGLWPFRYRPKGVHGTVPRQRAVRREGGGAGGVPWYVGGVSLVNDQRADPQPQLLVSLGGWPEDRLGGGMVLQLKGGGTPRLLQHSTHLNQVYWETNLCLTILDRNINLDNCNSILTFKKKIS